MWSKCFCLLSLWAFSVTAIAIPNADLISNLQSRLQVSPKGGKLIKSFSNHSQSYIYDQALAHVALQRIDIDLDDGVKHNYELFQGIEVASEGAKKQTIDLLAKL